MDEARAGGRGRLLMGAVWAALLCALWLWGRAVTEVPYASWPATGDLTAAGRPPVRELPPPHAPLAPAPPRLLAIRAMGLKAPVEAHGLTREGAAEPPPYDRAGAVAWYRGGPQPGSTGAAVLVGHVDTDRAPAVFYRLGDLRRGETVTVDRADGTTAEFTVDDVTVVGKDHFDPGRVYGPHAPGRAELRLITCGGDYDHARRAYDANVVVSAYLTGTGPA
ncbi:class F sortase [Streptomyces caatingaensis]|uniref:Sortase n=1 Tax=Streptomyces caatingaensis TaxID=1678637 RepID=A0A0K9X869_9ACTN|nr:class F sortase [Streptomyces caatingaensis]KNB49398.1 sortase [Streptomyces caatingaensis]